MKDLYAVLGVPPEASQEEIRDAYYSRLLFEGIDAGEDNARAREVREAYEVLSDPERRHSYDVSNGVWQSTATAAAPR